MSAYELDFLSYVLLVEIFQRLIYTLPIFGLALLVSRLLRHRLPGLQLTLWSLVVLRMLFPAGLSSSLSLREFLVPILPDLFGFAELRLRLSELPFVPIGVTSSSPTLAGGPAWLTWYVAMVVIWLLIASFQLIRFLVARRTCWRVFQEAEVVSEPWMRKALAELQRRHGINRVVEVRAGNHDMSPFTIGLWRPKVYLPAMLLGRRLRCEIEAVLSHELAHVRRFDDFWVCLYGILRAVFFFCPPLWYAARQASRSRELLCDQLAVVRGGMTSSDYVHGLIAVYTRAGRMIDPAAPSMASKDAEFCFARIAAVRATRLLSHFGLTARIVVAALVIAFVFPFHPHTGGREVQARNFLEQSIEHHPFPAPTFLCPIDGAFLGEPFRMVPLDERTAYHFHTGIDLHAPVGSTIHAIASGIVEYVVSEPKDFISSRTGSYVRIRHDDYVAMYTYVEAQLQPGDLVVQGEVIGTLRAPPPGPVSKSPHMHFEISYRGRALDPAPFFGRSEEGLSCSAGSDRSEFAGSSLLPSRRSVGLN